MGSGLAPALSRGPDPHPTRDPDDRRPRVIERLPYKSDGVGFTFDLSSHLYVFDLESERVEELTSGPWQDREPAWSPDGRRLAFASERHPERGRDLGADLFVLEVGTGELSQLTRTSGQVHVPCWSPDGALLAYAGTDRLRSSPSHRRLWWCRQPADRPVASAARWTGRWWWGRGAASRSSPTGAWPRSSSTRAG